MRTRNFSLTVATLIFIGGCASTPAGTANMRAISTSSSAISSRPINIPIQDDTPTRDPNLSILNRPDSTTDDPPGDLESGIADLVGEDGRRTIRYAGESKSVKYYVASAKESYCILSGKLVEGELDGFVTCTDQSLLRNGPIVSGSRGENNSIAILVADDCHVESSTAAASSANNITIFDLDRTGPLQATLNCPGGKVTKISELR